MILWKERRRTRRQHAFHQKESMNGIWNFTWAKETGGTSQKLCILRHDKNPCGVRVLSMVREWSPPIWASSPMNTLPFTRQYNKLAKCSGVQDKHGGVFHVENRTGTGGAFAIVPRYAQHEASSGEFRFHQHGDGDRRRSGSKAFVC
jgi:hypothetical protein